MFGCSVPNTEQTTNNTNKESNNFKAKSFQYISESECDSSGGYTRYEPTGEYTYPYEDYIVYGDNGNNTCLSGKNSQGYYSDSIYDLSPRVCLSLRDWSEYERIRFSNYQEVLNHIKTRKVPVTQYAGCHFPDPRPPYDDSGYGNPYGNPDDGNISYSGTYEPFQDGMYTLSVNLNNSSCRE